jgi:D-glycero-D-manno-heptose 1,7-bisphosphate phosphatase
MKGAVFLDRDGTVSEEVGYVNHVDRYRVYPWTADAIRKLNDSGTPVFLVTNQSGVARGYFPEELVKEVHRRLSETIARSGAFLNGTYYCPHHPEGRKAAYRMFCDCRKPAPGMLLKASREHGVDLSRSFIIGDRYLDLETGFRAGARGILVLSGYGRGEHLYLREQWPRPPDHVAENLAEAVDWVLPLLGSDQAAGELSSIKPGKDRR